MALNLHQELVEIAITAGDLIMQYYHPSIEIIAKKDNSPVTKADIAANEYIIDNLERLTPHIPIISEENELSHNIVTEKSFWLVDPIDGTRSFISGNGDFTVNIALIEDNLPVLGVIYAPLKQTIYYNYNSCAFKMIRGQLPKIISANKANMQGLIAVVGSHHVNHQTTDLLQKLKTKSIMSISSSIKFCLLAEGIADIYPRFGTTKEWDTAAGHAILNAAGGRIEEFGGNLFKYGKADFINHNFIAYGASKN